MQRHAAAAQRGQQARGIPAAEEEPAVGWRLFQRFQQGVGCRFRKLRGIRQPDHFRAALLTKVVHFFRYLPHRVDAQGTFALLRLKPIPVRMGIGLHQLATVTLPATFQAIPLLAHQPAAHPPDQRLIAHTCHRLDQQRMVSAILLMLANYLAIRLIQPRVPVHHACSASQPSSAD